jgi:multiple antibiotic resistance protein
MHPLHDLFTNFGVQLFIIVDPLVAIPIFLSITPHNSHAERRQMALRGCLVAFLVLVFFILLGPFLLLYFGIETPAVQICGGILLFVIALEMLYGQPTKTVTSSHEENLAEAKEDISITPLAIPMLAGPGAITTCLLFAKKTEDLAGYLVLIAAAAAVFAITYLLLLRAKNLVQLVGGLGTTIITRIMGLVLAFIALQYAIDGVKTVFHL